MSNKETIRTELITKLLQVSDTLTDEQLVEILDKMESTPSIPEGLDATTYESGKFAWDTFRENINSAQGRDLNLIAVALSYNTLSAHFLVSRGMTEEEYLKKAQQDYDDGFFTMKAPQEGEG